MAVQVEKLYLWDQLRCPFTMPMASNQDLKLEFNLSLVADNLITSNALTQA